jgi:hypothetical protein
MLNATQYSYSFMAGDEEIQIYPNPVTDNYFVLRTESNMQKIEIVNIVGNTVYNEVFTSPTNFTEVRFDEIENGIYIIRIETADNQIRVKKFLVK